MVIIKDKDAIKLKIISLTIKINMDNINNIDYICSSKISETCLTVQYDVFTILIIRLFRVPSQPIKRAFWIQKFLSASESVWLLKRDVFPLEGEGSKRSVCRSNSSFVFRTTSREGACDSYNLELHCQSIYFPSDQLSKIPLTRSEMLIRNKKVSVIQLISLQI